MKRTDIINREIQNNGYKTYLEIGVDAGQNIRKINIDNKFGVDPNPKSKGATHIMSSDEFFKTNTDTFDIIFIDGLHEYHQVNRDIINSLNCLNSNGTILLHDLIPKSEVMQQVPRVSNEWTGDCWKAMVDIRKSFNFLTFTIDTDYGVGCIKPDLEADRDYDIKDLEYNYTNLVENKKDWLGLITVSDYLNFY
jgi:hypothetical protein